MAYIALLAQAIHFDCSYPVHSTLNDNNTPKISTGKFEISFLLDEAALKFKEICQIHAQAFSSAELMHGPKSIVNEGFTILALASRDASENSLIEVVNSLVGQGANIFITTNKPANGQKLPFVSSGHPLTDPLLLIICYYQFIEKLARARGLNPDMPPHLKKITETV